MDTFAALERAKRSILSKEGRWPLVGTLRRRAAVIITHEPAWSGRPVCAPEGGCHQEAAIAWRPDEAAAARGPFDSPLSQPAPRRCRVCGAPAPLLLPRRAREHLLCKRRMPPRVRSVAQHVKWRGGGRQRVFADHYSIRNHVPSRPGAFKCGAMSIRSIPLCTRCLLCCKNFGQSPGFVICVRA